MYQKMYYKLKPLLPRSVQIELRKIFVKLKCRRCLTCWPIDVEADGRPKTFSGWPGNKDFCLILTHDVDTARGQDNCIKLMRLEQKLGFVSSFNFVPERYIVSDHIRKKLTDNGFEVGVHGLNHDGRLFRSETIFNSRKDKINSYLNQWNSVGFRAPAMHHNIEMISQLNIEYDASTFDTDPFEPYPYGCKKIYPYWIQNEATNRGFVELPYMLPQDFTVFILLKNHDLSIWHNKLDWLVGNNGIVLLNTHPDYMQFNGQQKTGENYPIELYERFLIAVKEKYKGVYWHALPRDVANFWKETIVKPTILKLE